MKSLFLLFSLFIVSCNIDVNKVPVDEAKLKADSIRTKILEDSFGKAAIRDAYTKVAADQYAKSAIGSPVKIISAKFVQEEYSNYKSVRLVWKNISNKKIAGIKFSWTGTNAFGEPADVGAGAYGSIGGAILSRDGKTITKAWVTEVAFVDGSKWKVNQ